MCSSVYTFEQIIFVAVGLFLFLAASAAASDVADAADAAGAAEAADATVMSAVATKAPVHYFGIRTRESVTTVRCATHPFRTIRYTIYRTTMQPNKRIVGKKLIITHRPPMHCRLFL